MGVLNPLTSSFGTPVKQDMNTFIRQKQQRRQDRRTHTAIGYTLEKHV